jgi:chemotaxis protein MotB
MSIAHRITRVAAILACGGMLVGCVSQQKYDDTETSARGLQARNQELLQQNKSLQQSLDQKNAEIASLQAEKSNLNQRVQGLDSAMSNLRGNYTALDNRIQRMGGVDPATDRALRQLAQQHPDLISYDPSMGMVRFGSDLTFPSGSDQLKPEAMQGLQQLAQILKTSNAGAYEIEVIGYTDNQRPGKSAARFPTNRHLSVARAISVGNALQSAGLPGDRVLVAGWGEYRPAVPNNPRGGTAANRRVEIFLVASAMDGYSSSASDAVETSAQPSPAEERREYPMK